jgi:kynurenine formamidase
MRARRPPIDLTYAFDKHTVHWPGDQPFQREKEHEGISPEGYWYASGRYAASEHVGTHMDAPFHFGRGKRSLDRISVATLIAPAIVIDITRQCARDRDYTLAVEDVRAWETARGRVPKGGILLVRSGWGKYWPDKKRYLGSDVPGDTSHLHFPGISPRAADLLVKRGIAGAGIDTASVDHGQSTDFMTHRILNGAGIYALENVANLDKVPATGATVIALPMKIKGASGGPVRIVALLPERGSRDSYSRPRKS